MKLSHKIIFSFIFSIILSILIISVISKNMIDIQFNNFLVDELEEKMNNISKEINSLYKDNNYILSKREINSYANLENIIIHIEDLNGNTIYSSEFRKKHNHNTKSNHKHKHLNDSNISKSDNNYQEKFFPLLKKNKKTGNITIGFINNSYLTNNAIIFKNTLNKSFILSGIITIILSFIISLFLSHSITNPILKIIHMTNQINEGNLKPKNDITTSTKEILELSNTIEDLGNNLSNQEHIRNKYASDISHELRTPITAIKGYLEAIKDNVWEASEDNLNILISEVDRLSSLVSDLNKSFSAESFETTLDIVYFSITKELKEIVKSFIPIFNQNNLYIKMDLEEDLYINMDRNKLNQIMINLLSNSLKHLKKDGFVKIILKSENNDFIIKVIDNGIGIKKSDLPYIFNRFYRVDNSRSKKTGGSGIGLSIVKSFVEAHKGSIKIKSIYGTGTEVKIKIPKS